MLSIEEQKLSTDSSFIRKYMKRRYKDLIEIIFGAIALGVTTILLILVGNWGLKLTVARSNLGVILGWVIVFGCIGSSFILILNFVAFFRLICNTVQKVIRRYFNYEI
jgi:hypothetical protein